MVQIYNPLEDQSFVENIVKRLLNLKKIIIENKRWLKSLSFLFFLFLMEWKIYFLIRSLLHRRETTHVHHMLILYFL